MRAQVAYLEHDETYCVAHTGEHSFATGIRGQRALVSGGLEGRQVSFLARHPAAVRCLLVKAAFTPAWLDQLIASVLAVGPGLEPAGVSTDDAVLTPEARGRAAAAPRPRARGPGRDRAPHARARPEPPPTPPLRRPQPPLPHEVT